jgi:sugar lactone lactonase YvrE
MTMSKFRLSLRLAVVILGIVCLMDIDRASAAPGDITTVAGRGIPTFSGDGGPATQATLNGPWSAGVDANGNIYIADSGNHRIRRVGPDGVITTIAGNGTAGYSGDGGPATQAALTGPWGVTADANGNVYIADSGNNRVRRVGPDGVITTIAGTGTRDFSGDGGPATQASLGFVYAVAVDAGGNVYIADGTNRVRRVGTDGVITTIAGNGTAGYSGDGGPATQASLNIPYGVAVDVNRNVYIAEGGNNRIRRVGTDGVITTFAGNGAAGFSGDGGPAIQASLRTPVGVGVDAQGNVYIGDISNNRVRRVGTDGIITTIAGNGNSGFSGDGGPATQATFRNMDGIAVDPIGNVYVADRANDRIRRVGTDGVITTVAGNNGVGFSGDGGPATQARMDIYFGGGVAVDAQGNLYVSDTNNHRVRRVSPDGVITTFAGGGTPAAGIGDGGPATQARLNSPQGLAADASGNVYIADRFNNRIRRVSPDGVITTIVGTGQSGFSGDGGPATQARLNAPYGVAVDAKGNVYIADTGNHRVRRVGPDGVIVTVAGTGTAGFSGDGQWATGARLNNPVAVAVYGRGTVYVADRGNNRIRMVDEGSVITTVAGGGAPPAGSVGDEGLATQASLNNPWGVAVDGRGNVYIGDRFNNRVRRVGTEGFGIITTIAGTGAPGLSGDGGPATQAMIRSPFSVAVDAKGNVYIADTFNFCIRRVEAAPIVVAPPAVPLTPRHRAVVVATVTRDGAPVAGLEVSFSRTVSGRRPDYRWKGTTNSSGQVTVEIIADPGPLFLRTGASGYYAAQATDPVSGNVVAEWASIPINGGREITLSLPIGGQASITDVRPLEAPAPFTLGPNSPNPFNPATQIAYELPEAAEVRLTVYNALGQEVRALVQGRQEAGYYRVTWDGRDAAGRSVSSGLYFYRLTSGGFAETRKMLLLK